MKDFKRALRRHKSMCKFEKRLDIWVKPEQYFIDYAKCDRILYSGHILEDVKNDIRAGKFWNFLKWTSTVCSCSLCKGEKYKRPSKSELLNIILEELE